MRKIIGVIMALLIIGLYPLNSYALSCVEPGTPKEEFEKSDVVFHGYVKEYHTSGVLKDEAYVLEVKEVYKGEIPTETVKVYDPLGFWLSERVKENKEYLFYGNYGNGEFGLDRKILGAQTPSRIYDLGGDSPSFYASGWLCSSIYCLIISTVAPPVLIIQ